MYREQIVGGVVVARCQACGTDNAPGATYCVQCARKLDPETQEAVVRQRESHTATAVSWARILLAILVFLIVVAALTFVVLHVL